MENFKALLFLSVRLTFIERKAPYSVSFQSFRYTNRALHYDYLTNTVLVALLLPKRP